MKKILLSVLFLFCMSGLSAGSSKHYLKFDVHQQDYTFSTLFDCHGEDDCIGTIVKSVFRVRTNYDLYSHSGKHEGTGICRVLTLGLFYTWATEIDVYDASGDYVGMIDGQALTGGLAKFSIYDRKGTRVGIAYLERGGASFSIVDPDRENHHLVHLKRHFVEDVVDHWSVNVYETKAIDLRIIKIFAAFAVDTQNSFKEDS